MHPAESLRTRHAPSAIAAPCSRSLSETNGQLGSGPGLRRKLDLPPGCVRGAIPRDQPMLLCGARPFYNPKTREGEALRRTPLRAFAPLVVTRRCDRVGVSDKILDGEEIHSGLQQG